MRFQRTMLRTYSLRFCYPMCYSYVTLATDTGAQKKYDHDVHKKEHYPLVKWKKFLAVTIPEKPTKSPRKWLRQKTDGCMKNAILKISIKKNFDWENTKTKSYTKPRQEMAKKTENTDSTIIARH